MPRVVSLYESKERPMNWWRAFVCGAVGASFMAAFLDAYNMLGVTPFSLEVYLGSLVRGSQFGVHNWTVGVICNWVAGGFFGFFYAYCFEYVFKRSSTRLGTLLGFAHAGLAALAFFPFFNTIHEQLGIELYPNFGFFGSGLGPATPILLLVGHLVFGATIGLLYGPVRIERVRSRTYEPGESGTVPELGVITPEEDLPDRRVGDFF